MKRLLFLALIGCLGLNCPAQGFLKKLGNAAEKAAKSVEKVQDRVGDVTSAIFGEPKSGPWKQFFRVDSVSLQGDPATGEVLFTVFVEPPKRLWLEIGGKSADLAASPTGQKYSLKPLNFNSTGTKELMPGIARRYEFLIADVDPGMPLMSNVTVNFYAYNDNDRLGSNMSGVDPLVFKNLPIVWEPAREVNVKAVPWGLKSLCGIELVSAEGDLATGNVTITVAATTRSSKADLQLGRSGRIKAYDTTGREYAGEETPQNYGAFRELNKMMPTRFSFVIPDVEPETPALYLVRMDFYANDHTRDLSCGSNMADVQPLMFRNVLIDWK